MFILLSVNHSIFKKKEKEKKKERDLACMLSNNIFFSGT